MVSLLHRSLKIFFKFIFKKFFSIWAIFIVWSHCAIASVIYFGFLTVSHVDLSFWPVGLNLQPRWLEGKVWHLELPGSPQIDITSFSVTLYFHFSTGLFSLLTNLFLVSSTKNHYQKVKELAPLCFHEFYGFRSWIKVFNSFWVDLWKALQFHSSDGLPVFPTLVTETSLYPCIFLAPLL